jgi:hypothetical protein
MKILATFTGALFAASMLLMASPASAGGDCPFGHTTKSVQSSSPTIAENPYPQTPKPNPGG